MLLMDSSVTAFGTLIEYITAVFLILEIVKESALDLMQEAVDTLNRV